ncbi:hypothetical protein [Nitratireductor sp. ZSWI3]|uniref:hypothetical protein n=1 Tax=Nitratireductor sp. ZSWI3 TaxID=2966359 RepID=UPI00214FD9B1|nr:hypothetical protein [Nitratireductor sp. ZSWI3]MCR4267774.1 hypothetical protein [Nitratireductor sp. ZSWI3]
MARLQALAAGLAASLAATLAPMTTADAADPVGVYTAYDGVCADASVRSAIQRSFRYQVTHVVNLPDVDIVDFYGARETRFRPAGVDSPIERRYCQATARLSDGRDRTIWYLIEYGQGFAGIGNNVEFCVSGFDRWNVYDGHCRVLR